VHIDYRSLAFFRMALGTLVFALALQLAPDCSAFYSHPPANPALIRVLIFFILPLFSVLLAFGFLSQLSVLICWFGVVLVQQANPHILYGADTLMRVLLFWSIFLPLGATWSIDARLFKKAFFRHPLTRSTAAWAITLQICFVYWFAAMLKTDPMWTRSGNALFYALNMEHLTSPWGLSMRQYPELLRWLTKATLYLEFLSPFLLFIPFHRDRFRMLAIILFLIFHLIGMQSLLLLGFFPWVCAAAWLIFLPGFFWDFLTRTTNPSFQNATPIKATALDWSLTGLLILSLADITAWNVASLRGGDYEQWMKDHDITQNILHINQRWRMYAPQPYGEHGWLVIPTKLVDGTEIDLFTGKPLSWAKPPNIADYLGSDRWRGFFDDLMYNPQPESLRQYSDDLVTRWNISHPANQKAQSLSVIYMKQTLRPDLILSEPEHVSLYSQKY